ncbi:TetR/AcrR family transcriptional regulator [Aquabacterium sp.]|uniref:TetR/AcrR family transcriptional regulator n=1 Tax=Aquabacterium sp. TaxID=1872578 RepID=UPI002E36CF05|nr:WHG domain-containing protein [Aquabacterium sp.]HEX5310853.1 WHG domain-containing protein [Aquabacterium sp.]
MSSTPKDARKQREAEQRRKAIIKIVRKLIKKGGVGEISLRKVAELAGYSTTVVYSLFGDKGTLITQAMDEDLLELTGFMRQAVEAHTDPLDRIRATARAYIHFGVTHPDEYAFVFMQRRPHAPNESARVQHGDPLQDPYAFARALFAQWAATGVVRDLDVDVDLMTQIFWEGIHGFTARHLVMGLDDTWMPEVPNEAHRDLMIEVLLTGLAAAFAPR